MAIGGSPRRQPNGVAGGEDPDPYEVRIGEGLERKTTRLRERLEAEHGR